MRELATRDERTAGPEPPADRADAEPRDDPEPERDAVPAGVEV